MKPFTVSAHALGGPGSVALRPDGTALAAYPVPFHDAGAVKVCILHRAGTACASDSPTVDAEPTANNDLTGNPEIFATSNSDVYLLVSETAVGQLLYSSTDGGVTFGATPLSLGSDGSGVAVDNAALVGSSVVWGSASTSDGALVQSVSLTTPTAPATTATASAPESEAMELGSYKGGALVANASVDDGLVVTYAPAGSDFNATASYQKAGTFADEDLIGMSGSVLLTQSTAGKDPLQIRVFNGTAFGPAHTVPHGDGAGPEVYDVDQDPSGQIHVFTEPSNDGYDLEEQSTATGASWTTRQDIGYAGKSFSFSSALDKFGSGIVLGPGLGSPATGTPAIAYPVLERQSVTFSLNHSSVNRTHHVKASGKVSPAKKGRKVELEVDKKGLWYNVASAKETASGAFHLALKDKKKGKLTYRAVASDTAGFVQFGYSSARKLSVKA